MKSRFVTLSVGFALLLVAAACEKSSPVTPSEVVSVASVAAASVTEATSSVTVGAPQPVSPADGAQFKFVEQPVKVAITNGVTTGSAPLTYSFEVATDAGFANKVFTKDNVAEGAGGQTNLTLDRLSPARTYFWRARSGSAGPSSKVRSFSIGPEVILQTPVLGAPAQNATLTNRAATLTVNNVGRTGPAERVTYRFEVSDSSSFANLVFTSTVLEQPGSQTSATMNITSTVAATYFWRVQASDPPNLVTTAFSAVESFKFQPFSMRDARIWDNPQDLGNDYEHHLHRERHSGRFRQEGRTWPLARRGLRRRIARVHARDVSEPGRTVALLGRRPILVRARVVRVRPAGRDRNQLVLRRALGGLAGSPAGEW
jgi:hypothetical protein